MERRIRNTGRHVDTAERPPILAPAVETEVEREGAEVSCRSHDVPDPCIPVAERVGEELRRDTGRLAKHVAARDDFALELRVGQARERRVRARVRADLDAAAERRPNLIPTRGRVHRRAVPWKRRRTADGFGDEKDRCGHAERADDRNGVLEDAGVSIVEGYGSHRSQAAAAREPFGELAEADHIVVGGEPAHLPREPLASFVKARAAGALRGFDDVVVAEDEAGVLQPSPNGRNTSGAKATIVGPRDQTHRVCAAFLVATTMTLLDTPRSTQDRVRISRPEHARSLFISYSGTGLRTLPAGRPLTRSITR